MLREHYVSFKRVMIFFDLSSKLNRFFLLITLILSFVTVARIGCDLLPAWQSIKGWEAYNIAQALALGEGYSFPASNRWLFPPSDQGTFHPTAWVDPPYTFCLAALIWVFGPYHQLAAAIFNLCLLFAALMLTYKLGERLLNAPFGFLAVIILVSSGFVNINTISQMNNTMFASVLILVSALALLGYLQSPSLPRSGVLGLILGFTVLGCPGAQFFILVTPLAIVLVRWRERRQAVWQALTVAVAAVVILAPWMIRNYLIFDEFVPVRTGAGTITFIGVVAVAGTVDPNLVRSVVKPSWSEKNPRSAVKLVTLKNELSALQNFQMQYIGEVGPHRLNSMNEAQRDAWFLGETKIFLAEHPFLSMQLAAAKIEVFVRIMGAVGVLVFAFAVLGGALSIGHAPVMMLALWVVTYIAQYTLIICFYGRYRAPIEPLLVIISLFAVYRLATIFRNWMQPQSKFIAVK